MTPPLPSIPQAVALAYRDLARVARSLTRLAGIAVAIVFVTSAVEPLLLSPELKSTSADVLLVFLFDLLQTFLLTPYLMAVHRFVILGESPARYALAPLDRRVQSYFLMWAAFSAATMAPIFLWVASPWMSGDPVEVSPLVVPVMAYVVAVMILGLRLIILFPAIAVDASEATFAAALPATKGHAWRIFLIGLMAFFPLWALDLMTTGIRSDGGASLSALLLLLANSVISMVMTTLFLVIASRLYEWLGAPTRNTE